MRCLSACDSVPALGCRSRPVILVESPTEATVELRKRGGVVLLETDDVHSGEVRLGLRQPTLVHVDDGEVGTLGQIVRFVESEQLRLVVVDEQSEHEGIVVDLLERQIPLVAHVALGVAEQGDRALHRITQDGQGHVGVDEPGRQEGKMAHEEP